MEWYTPLTILPAIALIILSTSNFLVALNNEIYELEKEKAINMWVIQQKLLQLKRFGRSNALLYASALFFMFASLGKVFFESQITFKLAMVLATLLFTIALIILFIHSLKAISIYRFSDGFASGFPFYLSFGEVGTAFFGSFG